MPWTCNSAVVALRVEALPCPSRATLGYLLG